MQEVIIVTFGLENITEPIYGIVDDYGEIATVHADPSVGHVLVECGFIIHIVHTLTLFGEQYVVQYIKDGHLLIILVVARKISSFIA